MRTRHLVSTLAAVTLLVPAGAHAQDGFLFGGPKAQLTLRAGPVLHRAGGDLFQFMTSELTLERGDFRAPSISGEIALVAHRRIDLVLGAGWSRVETRSASFDSSCEGTVHECTFVDAETELPIEQTTSLRLTPLTVSARFYPLARGRAISDLAWIPARTTPYIGGGAGLTFYRLHQSGEFVDSEDLAIFPAELESSGQGLTGHVFAGLDHWFSPKIGLNAEGRYTLGSATPGDDFQTWDSIDLSGLQLGLGLSLRW